ncbi:SDR family NAD(P)-dependent oxidoreductase [Mucilaginibacter mali]|uniref:SDR family NAD(P)-dependent oxidoreductase n=1 Tax=Mucilaginibacter mali TaxID=2740462 RepID=A0A7D4TNA6_9SPHI|nr:SDR family NAD(P)-dependent oxidoreductase [Mucilaginibacter mali]QKJ29694.1 SDR family NAD(P)-dependent oxidoreductase [Mucilaginibacter mali]
MNINNKTILVTGGGSGIGLEIAKQLLAKGNKVIITGRTEEKLKKATETLNGVHYIATDVNNAGDVAKLEKYLSDNFGGLDILINNAGQASYYKLDEDSDIAAKAAAEIQTNYLAIINLNEKLLPLLKASKEAAIVNVSSIAAFVPNSGIPTYSASKAALHSYSQSLRYVLGKTTAVKVFELMPPLVNTEFSSAIGGANGIPPAEVADSLVEAFENDIYEIHTGKTAAIYELSRTKPEDAFYAMNQARGN